MTGHERLLALLHRRPVDRLSWTTLVDDITRSAMPPEWRELPVLEFYRRLRCDVFQFGNHGLPRELQVPLPGQFECPGVGVTVEGRADGAVVQTTRTPWGSLTAISRNGHPLRHAVQTPDDLAVMTAIWRHGSVSQGAGAGEAYARTEAALGDDGLYLPTLAPSPLQQLLQIDMGLVSFYALLQDRPREMEELFALMHQARCAEYELAARELPVAALIAVENTSTRMLSPTLYARYSVPQLRDYAEICHRHGQRLVLHMCGHLRDLLALIPETGADAINALTPPPVGDTTVEMALDALGEDFPLLGGVLQETAFQAPTATPAGIRRALGELYTPRVRQARLLLWAAADGLATPVERFLAVSQWMDEHAALL
jgi:hypothetical protein